MNLIVTILTKMGFEPPFDKKDWLRADVEMDSTELVEFTLEIKELTGKKIEITPEEDLTLEDIVSQIEEY